MFYCCTISVLFQSAVSVTSLLLHDRYISDHVLNVIMIASHWMILLISFLTIILIDKPKTIGICLNLCSSKSRSQQGPECWQFIWKVIPGSKNERIRDRDRQEWKHNMKCIIKHCCGLCSKRIVYRMPLPITVFLRWRPRVFILTLSCPHWLRVVILILLLFHDAFTYMQTK